MMVSMLPNSQLEEIKSRIASGAPQSLEVLQEDRVTLMAEVDRLLKFVENFSSRVSTQLDALEKDMVLLDEDNQRLRKNCRSSDFERDACVGLIAKMALALKIPVGIQKTENQNRVVLDLPSGQVVWEYLETEAHLFERLPLYTQPTETQSIQDTYLKVMNPNLDF